MKLYFGDSAFDGQLQRSVAKADSGMANVGECLAIANRITPGDRDSWYRAWSEFATRLVGQADEAAKDGHRVSARGAYLRAAEYFRQAFFFHRENLDGSELHSGYASSVQAFRSALSHFGHPGRILSGAVSGYLFTPGHTDGRCPTILHIGGYDGTAEELYASVPAALDRGYVVAVLDGPGQGAMLYDRRGPMRPDWENVVPALFAAVTAFPQVDPGQYDLGTALTARLGPLMDRVHDPAADPQFDALLDIPGVKALLEPRMATHGVTSVRAYCADVLRYTNADIVNRVVCPTFVTDNETDEVSTGQGKILFDHLSCPKEFRLFTKAEGAEGHCEGMAPVVFWDAAFNWLDSLLPPDPE